MVGPVAYTDLAGLRGLTGKAGLTEAEKLAEAARQFASVFTHMMIKSMRDAGLSEGAFDSDQQALYQDLFDKQISLELTRDDGLGIARLLIEQFEPRPPSDAHAQYLAMEERSTQGIGFAADKAADAPSEFELGP